ncbi:hypothetical protein TSOC_013152 [Tetrabaena socialis]|uniref:Uncharacterized protein n=1 Tax=Tetrabaena socialis TaxID=47790 RepID=A0A2J7ZL48_9CHLO|nr:hypothetical protein TSOC_013152 [Tetrabaena socialis]|eukprot:PNH00991.1 hypothetical protein TSOC_013152 [Tetrabaena socialis]
MDSADGARKIASESSIMGSPGFLLRPPAPPSASRPPAPRPQGYTPPSRSKGSAELDGRDSTPTRYERPPTQAPLPTLHNVLLPSSRPEPSGSAGHSAVPVARAPASSDPRQPHLITAEACWITSNTSSQAGAAPASGGSSAGGYGSSSGGGQSGGGQSGGGNSSGASSGGMSGPVFAGGRRFHDSFNSHCSVRSGRMPDYLKVYQVPACVQYEEDIILEPIIQALGVGDKEMEQRITEQMGQLYDFFRKLYQQDQEEIRSLQTQVAHRESELRRQRKTKMGAALSVAEEKAESPQSATKRAHHEASPARKTCMPQAGPVLALVVPPVINPARPFYKWVVHMYKCPLCDCCFDMMLQADSCRWWANVDHSYQRHPTRWRLTAFALLLILAIGLLAGLLNRGSPGTQPPPLAPYTPPGPAITALGSTSLAFMVNMTQGASAFYALIPAVTFLTLAQPPTAADVRTLLQGPTLSPLQGLAVACAQRTAVVGRPLTFLVADLAAAQQGAQPGAGGGDGACEVRPASAYVLLVAFEGSSELYKLPASLDISLSLSSTGVVRYQVLHTVLYVQAGGMLASFASADPAIGQVLGMSPAPSASVVGVGGVVAAGVVNVTQAGASYVIHIAGGGAIGSAGATVAATAQQAACACAAGGSSCGCTVGAPCLGALCGLGPSALWPGTTYKVFVSASTADGAAINGPVYAGSVTTAAPTSAPLLAPSAALAPAAVGATGFVLEGIQLDTSGIAYVMVVLAYLDAAVESLAAPVRCVALANRSSGPVTAAIGGLSNDTAYSVRLITEDASRNRRVYRAALRTRDLRPPDITSVAVRAAYRSFNLSVTLSEPGVVVGFLYAPANASAAGLPLTVPPVWPPSAPGQGSILQVTASADGASYEPAQSLLIFAGPAIAPKVNYTVALIARDAAGNVQQAVRLVQVRTEDNLPPQWLLAAVTPGAYDASLRVQLDEPGTVYYFCLTGDVACPPAATLFQAVDAPSTTPPGAFLASGSLATGASAAPVTQAVMGLGDDRAFTLCLVAQDEAPARNRQAAPLRLPLATLDRTPPELGVVAVPGTDGSFTCDSAFAHPIRRSKAVDNPYAPTPTRLRGLGNDELPVLCRLVLNVSLSEPGAALLALQYDPPATSFTAASLSAAMDASAPAPGILRAGSLDFAAPGWQQLTLNGLASGRRYSLAVAGVDAAGNLRPALALLTAAAPDLMPPLLVRYTASAAVAGAGGGGGDTAITVNATLNEACTVFWTAQAAGSPTPTAVQLAAAAGAAAQQQLQQYGAYGYSAAGSPATWVIPGLVPGMLYDIHLVARDLSGNTQAAVSSLRGVRTSDSRPPAILALVATASTVGNRFTLTANSSKPGTLRFIAVHPGSPVPTREQLLAPASYAAANFSGVLVLPTAFAAASVALCVADGASLQVWGVQEDLEGTFAGRLPNYSNITRAAQALRPASADNAGTCSPEAGLRALRLDTSLTPGSLGWPVGRLTAANGSSPGPSWVRDYVMLGGAGGAVGSDGTIVASMEGVAMGSLRYRPVRRPTAERAQTHRPDPTRIRVALQTPNLYLEAAAAASTTSTTTGTNGATTLRFAYQLTDDLNRTTVGTDSLRIVPSLVTTLAASADGRLALPDCAAPAASGSGGIGIGGNNSNSSSSSSSSSGGSVWLCRVEVPAQAFPAAGASAAASLRVDVYSGAVLLASSTSSGLSLSSAAAASLAAPANGTALLVALPARPLHPGETFRATLTAAVGGQQGLSGFSLQLSYDSSLLIFVRAEQSPLWSDLVAVPLGTGAGSGMQLWLTALTRTGDDAQYLGRSIPLVYVYFRLAPNTQAAGILAALDVSGATSSLYPYAGSVPIVQFSDAAKSSPATALRGSVLVAQARQLTVFAELPSHQLFNTAVLGGVEVVAPIQASQSARGRCCANPLLAVYDWAASGAAEDTVAVAAPSGCSCSASDGAAASSALSVSSCRVVLTAAHSQPAKQAGLLVDCGGGGSLRAETSVTVWFPTTLHAEAADPDGTLSSLLPLNVPPPPPNSCTDRYQSTVLSLTATWINGGSSPDDYLSEVEVTGLVANWTTDQPQALRVAGPTAQGLLPTTGAMVTARGPSGISLASTRLAVSDVPVCVEALQAVAISGVLVGGDGGTEAAQPSSPGRWRVRFTAQQALNWERATARVSVFATLSDGAVMPVSRAAATVLVSPSAAAAADAATPATPMRLQALSGAAPMQLAVNASFGAPAACGDFLRSSWSVCAASGARGVQLAAGTGSVRVALPTPLRIASLLLSSRSIASSGSGAAQDPISLPTRASLKVLVAFDDESVHDMTADSRVTVRVTQGTDLCAVAEDPDTGAKYVAALASPGIGGKCSLEARAAFGSGLPLLLAANSTTVVTLTALQVYTLDGAPPPLPPTTNSSSLTFLAPPGETLRLFKCDFSHYVPASVWVMGRLSSCGASCDLADLNDSTAVSLALTDTTALTIVRNPANSSLSNVLLPTAAGSSRLTVAFGNAASVQCGVEDPFQPGWPRVANISDNGFVVSAAVTSAAFRITYLVRRILSGGDTAVPTATEVERAGVALSLAGPASASGAALLSDSVSGLSPASNYSVFLAVRFQSRLLETVVAISGVLTPDRVAPTFTAVGMLQNLTADSQRFTMRLPVALSEPGTVFYAVYRNSSCIAGDQVAVASVLGGAPLPPSTCWCADRAACEPVATGNATLRGDVLSDTLTLSGLLPPNPYAALRGASGDQLTCGNAALPPPASAAHVLYLAAQDDLPTYKDWAVTCTPPVSSPGSACGAIARAPCTAAPPVPGSGMGGVNQQTRPYSHVQLTAMAAVTQQAAPAHPVLATFDLPGGERVAFDPAATTVTASGRTITFSFRVSRVAAVQYRLDVFEGSSVYSGTYPIFDPTVTYSVSISKTCTGALISEPSYTLWYWATDVFGRLSTALSASVVL